MDYRRHKDAEALLEKLLQLTFSFTEGRIMWSEADDYKFWTYPK